MGRRARARLPFDKLMAVGIPTKRSKCALTHTREASGHGMRGAVGATTSAKNEAGGKITEGLSLRDGNRKTTAEKHKTLRLPEAIGR